MLDAYLRCYNEEQLKERLGWMSPMQCRRSLGLAVWPVQRNVRTPVFLRTYGGIEHFCVRIVIGVVATACGDKPSRGLEFVGKLQPFLVVGLGM